MRDANNLLVCHSDEVVLTFLADNLSADQYEVRTATVAREARLKLDAGCPDLVVCGRLAEPTDQPGLLRWLRGHLSHAGRPFVALCTAADELALLRLFEAGADDVVGEPFSYPELRARIAARLVRRDPVAPLAIGVLTIDPATRSARVAGAPLHLSRLEFALLHRLASEGGAVVEKRTLLAELWGYPEGYTRTVDAHACRLRRRLADAGLSGAVDNVRGVGYRLRVEDWTPNERTGPGERAARRLALVDPPVPAEPAAETANSNGRA